MAKMDEVQTMAALSLARQQQTDMRVDVVEQTANEARALAAGAAAGGPAGNVDLAGLAGWAPKALSAWKTTAGGGSCAVCVPDGCVSYAGTTVPASKFHPGVETKLGLRYCTVPPAEGGQGGKLFLTVTVPTSGGSEGEVDGVYIEWAASEAAARNAHSSGSVDIVACVLLVETVNGELQQRHTGNVILGAGKQTQSSPPGNFEPVFVNGVLDSVGEGYWPFGRQFSNVVTVDSSAKIAEGFIYLEITHPVPSSSGSAPDPSAVVKGVGPSGTLPSFWNTDTTKSLIPLYRIANGAMTRDFRSCMSLTMREL